MKSRQELFWRLGFWDLGEGVRGGALNRPGWGGLGVRAKHIRWARLGLVLEFESSTRTGERRGMTSGDHQSVRVREGERR